jgi:hypothetical protein
MRSRADMMADAVKQGESPSSVARRFRVSAAAVHKACLRRGVPTPRQGAKARNRRILAALATGILPGQVAVRFGVPVSVVYGARWRSRQQRG